MVPSRLAEYEVWTRVHTRKLGTSHGEQVRRLIGRLALVELAPAVLKVLSDSFANDPDRPTRFQREAQVLASLNHPRKPW